MERVLPAKIMPMVKWGVLTGPPSENSGKQDVRAFVLYFFDESNYE